MRPQLARNKLYAAADFPRTGHVLVEPKIDGYRLLAIARGGKIVLSSREGLTEPQTTNLAHIVAQLRGLGLRDGVVDGEILVKDWNGTALIKKKHLTPADRATIEKHGVFAVFDYVTAAGGDQVARRRALERFVGRGTRHIKVLPQFVARTHADVLKLYKQMRAQGHEGAMVKRPDALYRPGARVATWLKLKHEETTDGRIVGVRRGTGKDAKWLGALVVRVGKHEIRVGSGFTNKLKAQLWRDRTKIIGQVVEFKWNGRPKKGSTRPATFLRLRVDRGRAGRARRNPTATKTFRLFPPAGLDPDERMDYEADRTRDALKMFPALWDAEHRKELAYVLSDAIQRGVEGGKGRDVLLTLTRVADPKAVHLRGDYRYDAAPLVEALRSTRHDLVPILVGASERGLHLLDGHHRWRAYVAAGLQPLVLMITTRPSDGERKLVVTIDDNALTRARL